MRDVQVVAEQQLEGMGAGRELDRGLGLAAAEVADLPGLRQRQAHVDLGGVDQQVVVAGVRVIEAGGRHAHAAQAELHRHRRGHDGAVGGRDEVDRGALGRGLARQLGGGRRGQQRERQSGGEAERGSGRGHRGGGGKPGRLRAARIRSASASVNNSTNTPSVSAGMDRPRKVHCTSPQSPVPRSAAVTADPMPTCSARNQKPAPHSASDPGGRVWR